MKLKLMLVALVVLAALLTAMPALADDGSGEHCGSGQDFGQHVSDHAQEGILNGDHNPGMHQGFSHCL